MKKRIVIAEYVSTGYNMVYDVLSRGYEPVLLDCPYVAEQADLADFHAGREAVRARLPKGLIHIPENADYQAVLEQVRALQPILVIAGSEFGVPYATRLAADLGLPGNPVDRLKAMTEKDSMHQALKEYGIRYIRGQVISTVDEARAYYQELNTEHVVVKRVRGVGTQGVYLCKGLEETLAAVEKELAAGVLSGGEAVALLMQERIIGTEYIVNTVSCNGRHRVASIWQYDKVKMANGTNAYNYAQTVNKLDIGHSRLVSYAFDVLDAIGIQYGPVHGEFMIDERGPVLIEVNCRPMGGGMSRKFVEQLFGHHETDCALDAYLNPDKFEEELNKPYRPLRKGAMKFFILPRDVAAETTPIVPISKRLKSFHKGLFDRVGRDLLITQTKNLETTGGMVYLIHPDEQVVIDECNLLHTIEMKYPDILFQQTRETGGSAACRTDIAAIMKEMRCGGGTLVFSDTDVQVEGATVISEKELRSAYDSYEQGILDLSKPETFADLEIVIRQIYEFADKIRENGRIIIPESTYANLPYGMEGMEILLRITGLRIETPRAGMKNVLVASVEK